ncbi:hypothetical protein CcCBS67573_g09085 [Chytriomyces confervae]|uniref:Elongation factor 1 alpha-like protein n=1 Tax=Chytriomyces confervae TaxID=246404 RepID=A0A507E6G1_9FUNG|nr:hypothetical protein CcCBS67573_g09085 [Chytriomyces confervae]
MVLNEDYDDDEDDDYFDDDDQEYQDEDMDDLEDEKVVAYVAPSKGSKETVAAADIRSVQAVVGSGYSVDAVRQALFKSGGNVESAVNNLLENLANASEKPMDASDISATLTAKPSTPTLSSLSSLSVKRPVSATTNTPGKMQPSGMTLASLSDGSLKSAAIANPSLSLSLNSPNSEKKKPLLSTPSSISNSTAPKLTLGQTKQSLPTSSSSNNVISNALSAMSLAPSLTSKPNLLVPKTASSNVTLSTLSALSQSKNSSLQPSKLPMAGASTFSKLPTQIAGLNQQQKHQQQKHQQQKHQQQKHQQQKLQPSMNPSTVRSDLQFSSSSAVAAPASSLALFWASTNSHSTLPFTHSHFSSPSPFAKKVSFMLSNPFLELDAGVVGGQQARFDFTTPSPDDIVRAARAGKPAPSITLNSAKSQPQSKSKSISLTQSMKSISIATTPTLNTPTNHASPSRTSNSPTIRARSPSPAGSATSSQAPVSNVSIKPAPQPSVAKGKRINVVQEYAKRNLEKSSLNLVVVGHVDAGKSTLMGHLLYLLGEVNERTMKKYERDAEKMKKGSFCFAWVLDETEEERSRGVTIDVGMSYFETQLHRFTILDAPGHRDFVPNMISGASQADVALLVIDSGTGEFEVGFELGGQTREHALLVRSLGVAQMVVAMQWSESRFYEIKEKLTFFLLGAGFKKDKLTFVPCSGFTGENMIECKSQELLAWYEGPTLRECLDALQPPVRPLEKPFRLPVTDYFKGGSTAGGGGSLSVSGRIEAGTLQIGDAVTIMPLGEHGVVKAIESNNEAIKWAVAGDNVVITLNGIDVQQISIGNVLCAPQSLVPVADVFQVKIVTFDIAIPLTLGVPIVLHHQSASTPGIISKLVSILNKASGEVIKKNPRALPKNVTAIVDIKLDKPICVELAKESRELGRVMIRSGSTVVAAGIVTEIVNRVK